MEISTTTGAGPLLSRPGMLVRVKVDERDQRNLALGWAEAARDLLEELDVSGSEIDARITEHDLLLGASLPVDLLPIGAALARELIRRCLDQPGESTAYWKARIVGLHNPRLRQIHELARQHGVLCRVDGESLSLGCGDTLARHALSALPDPESIDWLQHGRVPMALLAGFSNAAKIADLLLAMAKEAGLKATHLADDQRPALKDLDHRGLDMAVLSSSESALLTGGVALAPMDCVAIGAEGMGSTGARKALKDSGRLVLPLAMPSLRGLEADARGRSTWYGHARGDSWLKQHIDDGEAACLLEDGSLLWHCGGSRLLICTESALPSGCDPLSALCAIAVATSLRLPFEGIQLGLLNAAAAPSSGTV